MFGKIKFISGNVAHVETVCSAEEMGDLMNVHVVFEEKDQAILGEVEEVTDEIIKIRFLGEFRDGRYVSGVIRKPVLSSKIRTITSDELDMIVGVYDETTFKLGRSSIYTDYEVCADINNLFANHMAVFGNTGSGKSCGVARLVQNIFSNPKLVSYNANIFIFDACLLSWIVFIIRVGSQRHSNKVGGCLLCDTLVFSKFSQCHSKSPH